MTKVICDAVLREKLHGLAKPLEMCDESGHILARLVPAIDREPRVSAEPQISGEELDRRIASAEGPTRLPKCWPTWKAFDVSSGMA